MKKDVDILILGGLIVTMDQDETIHQEGAVAINDGKIVDLGEIERIRSTYRGNTEIDATGCVVMPGLINVHTHSPMTVFRGLADDLPLMTWLKEHIFPAEKKINRDIVYKGTLLACAEMILGGTTTFVDMYYFEDKAAEATKKAGLRAVLGETILDFPSPDSPNTEAQLKYAEKFIQSYKDDELITPAVAPHAPYTCSPDTLIKAKNIADRYSVPYLIHLSETQDEVNTIQERYGKRPVEHLEAIGVLSRDSPSKIIAAHCVWLTDKEIDILRDYNVGVAHNPESNMKLASGIAPVTEMLENSIDVGLGTDGAASNNNLDMIEEMHTAALIHKVFSGDPTTLPAEKVVEMATIRGARAIGMDHKIGSLEPGKYADIILISTDAPNMTPLYNVYSHIVYAASSSDVDTTIVHGRILMENREIKTFDEKSVKEKARELGEKVKESLKDNNNS